MNLFKNEEELRPEDYVIATYWMQSSTTLRDAAWALAIGQSVGNPNVRNQWETEELFANHSCMIIGNEIQLKANHSGVVRIAFPVVNTDWKGDGINHLMCQLMGGQMDIDIVRVCRLIDVQIPDSVRQYFPKPTYGISGFRKFTGNYNKPFLGGIVKPKTGISPAVLLEMTKQLVDGGVDFIKEDEILSNPAFCSLEERVPIITNYLANQSRKVIYCFCINGEPHVIRDRAQFLIDNGANGVHINFWSSFGVYRTLAEMGKLFIHYQKSGDKVITDGRNPYGIEWNVLCKLAGLAGVDSIHSGMWGGYMSDDEKELRKTLSILRKDNVVPALSCGMHPGLVQVINKKFGFDYMANVGGAIHGHPGGTVAGARAMRQAIEGSHGTEYNEAIEKWGLVQ